MLSDSNNARQSKLKSVSNALLHAEKTDQQIQIVEDFVGIPLEVLSPPSGRESKIWMEDTWLSDLVEGGKFCETEDDRLIRIQTMVYVLARQKYLCDVYEN